MGIQRNTCRNGGRIEIGRRGVLLGLAGASIAAGCQPMPLAEDVPGGAWRKGVALPLAVQEIYPALHAGRIHVAGGFVAENGAISGPTDAHFAFDRERGDWSEFPPLPNPRHHPHLVSFQGRLVAFGGFESPSADAVWQMQSSGWALPPAEERFVYYPPLQ
ncbi:MAG: galactose oxidase, partial [Pseudomonadota bacterium]